MTLYKLTITILLSTLLVGIQAQDIRLKNPSFEGRPYMGEAGYNLNLEGWYDCGIINFPTASPPDVHAGVNRDTAFWDNTVATSHGKTYLGMVVRDNESWESVSQRVSTPLKKGKCYAFSIYITRSETYNSNRMGDRKNAPKASFTEPAVLRIWAGNGYCGTSQLLGESLPIDHSDWREYVFQFEPDDDYQVITLEAFYKTPVLFSYNGHILLDNASHLDLVECETNYEVYVRERIARPEPPRKKMPAHKAAAQKRKTFIREQQQAQVDTITYVRPKKDNVLALDRKTIKKGQKIRIDKLYFDANDSNIKQDSYEVLDEIFFFMRDNPDIKIEVGGHTNGLPKESFCDSLSEVRAKAVTDYLISRGVEKERLEYKGYGKRKRIASDKTPVGRKRNQRVEIKIISMG